jgi:Fe-S cluster assembly ATP-binding protein
VTDALFVEGLRADLGDLQILRGVDLALPFGEVHALMGPNGSGKSTLTHALMGKDEYTVTGTARVDGRDILGLPVHERARLGLFEAFQYPVVVPGVRLDELVVEMAAVAPEPEEAASRVASAAAAMRVEGFLDRAVNDGLSGGEKKRSEMFQLAVAEPKVAVLDEVDSGLDIDAVREVAELVEDLRSDRIGVLIITHYSRILRYLRTDRIHVMVRGQIVRSGGSELAEELEATGYDHFRLPVDEPA